MRQRIFRVGQRVLTHHQGPGKVVGFERFDQFGMTAEPSLIDNLPDSRVVVQLDDPERWAFHGQDVGLPHYPRRELSPEGEGMFMLCNNCLADSIEYGNAWIHNAHRCTCIFLPEADHGTPQS